MCNIKCPDCGCFINNTTINSDQAGRDGLSAKQIKINLGQLPSDATDQQFLDSMKGAKGDPGKDGKDGLNGGGIYLKTEW